MSPVCIGAFSQDEKCCHATDTHQPTLMKCLRVPPRDPTFQRKQHPKHCWLYPTEIAELTGFCRLATCSALPVHWSGQQVLCARRVQKEFASSLTITQVREASASMDCPGLHSCCEQFVNWEVWARLSSRGLAARLWPGERRARLLQAWINRNGCHCNTRP